ncbi:carbohydrate kinase [Georhizobium profundi]|uniref:Carbohydrate kinase n=1 Tax=Georhizobium profundi TaxID=2341112 RepID=A0A3S9B1D3_9HYPH|nr:carbohydrate kinase [Georhizobium profundi]AZN70755.1 carbohydrate kinase [Georhizobium profundi]
MIVCCGEALIDMLPRKSVTGEDAFAPYAGGAVFNTAVALGRLGIATGFFTGLSSDMFGDVLRATLDSSHVDHRHCATLDRPTTLAFVKLTKGHASYAFFDENTAGRMITEADLPTFGADVKALHFGAISLIPEPCGATYEALMKREAARRVISLDPNIRPGFIPDRQAHLERMNRMIAMSDIVKLSDEDLAWFGFDTPEAAAAQWLKIGPSLVVVTKGAEGAVGLSIRHRVSMPGNPVDVADTVGAGDTFNAGILASLKRSSLLTKSSIAELGEQAIADALALGAKAASVTVSRPGANPPWAHEIGF